MNLKYLKASKQVLAMALSNMACKMIFLISQYVGIITCRGLNSCFDEECVKTIMNISLEKLSVLSFKVFSFTCEKVIDRYS